MWSGRRDGAVDRQGAVSRSRMGWWVGPGPGLELGSWDHDSGAEAWGRAMTCSPHVPACKTCAHRRDMRAANHGSVPILSPPCDRSPATHPTPGHYFLFIWAHALPTWVLGMGQKARVPGQWHQVQWWWQLEGATAARAAGK